jgi:hypothetical protein
MKHPDAFERMVDTVLWCDNCDRKRAIKFLRRYHARVRRIVKQVSRVRIIPGYAQTVSGQGYQMAIDDFLLALDAMKRGKA